MKTSKHTPLYLSLVSLLVLGLTSCNVNPQKSPSFVKLQSRVSKLEDGRKKADNSLTAIYFNVDTLDEEVGSLKSTVTSLSKSSNSNPKLLTESLNRIKALEQQLKKIQTELAAQKQENAKNLASQKKTIEQQAAALKTAERKAAARPTTGARASVASKTVTTAASSTRISKAPPKRGGFYYRVKKGDTLQDIGKRYKISSAKICRANHLPLSATLIPGQSIYIPSA